jgi:hypothetical protein
MRSVIVDHANNDCQYYAVLFVINDLSKIWGNQEHFHSQTGPNSPSAANKTCDYRCGAARGGEDGR